MLDSEHDAGFGATTSLVKT